MTLSRKADSTAVTIASMARMPAGLACTFFADQMAEVLEDAALPGDRYDDHHADEQRDSVKVDPCQRLLLRQDAGPDHQHGACKGNDGAIHPLADDDRVDKDEQACCRHERVKSEHTTSGAFAASASCIDGKPLFWVG